MLTVLGDEALTPDSSRFWPANEYAAGQNQNSYDKQVRLYTLPPFFPILFLTFMPCT